MVDSRRDLRGCGGGGCPQRTRPVHRRTRLIHKWTLLIHSKPRVCPQPRAYAPFSSSSAGELDSGGRRPITSCSASSGDAPVRCRPRCARVRDSVRSQQIDRHRALDEQVPARGLPSSRSSRSSAKSAGVGQAREPVHRGLTAFSAGAAQGPASQAPSCCPAPKSESGVTVPDDHRRAGCRPGPTATPPAVRCRRVVHSHRREHRFLSVSAGKLDTGGGGHPPQSIAGSSLSR
jgi:hypothetical protein